jgi:hypothetical protein
MIWQFVRRASVDFLGVPYLVCKPASSCASHFCRANAGRNHTGSPFHLLQTLLASMILAVEKAISIVRPNVVSVTLPLTDLESKTFRGMEGDMTMHDPEWQLVTWK